MLYPITNLSQAFFNYCKIGALVLLIAITGCVSNSGDEIDSSGRNYTLAMEAGADVSDTENGNDQELIRKLIKTGRVSFETEDLVASKRTVLDAQKKHGGYVSSDEEFNSGYRISNTLQIRVPSDKFDIFLEDATRGVEHFESKSVTVNDVTEEYLDVEARLQSKKKLESRYLELLESTKTISEILEIERQMNTLRSEIESIEGRLKYLKDQVAMSTLTIEFYEEMPNRTAFGDKFKDGFKNGLDNLIWFFVFIVNVWPFLIITIVLIILIRVFRRKQIMKNSRKSKLS